MPRWEPHAKQRLEQAALDLFAAVGYEKTTVSDIAARAGVTSRTYFRYYPDKREILFGGADQLRVRISCSLRDAPADLSPLAACLHAMSTCEELYDAHEHEDLRRRDTIIATSEELQEREARKLACIAADVADGLVGRGSDPADAELVADLAVAAFKHAARLWMDDPFTPYAVQLYRAAARAHAAFTSPTHDAETSESGKTLRAGEVGAL